MRHMIWLTAAGLLILTACTLTTPTPNAVSTPTIIATVIPDQPAPTLSNAGELQTPTVPNPASTSQPSVAGEPQVTKAPTVNQFTEGLQAPAYPFGLQSGTPAQLQNFLNSDGCNYLGVGGQVLKLNGDAVTGFVVEITGTLSGKNVLYLALTGNSQGLGPGGYAVKIGNQPVASSGTLKIQIFDLNGTPQTPLVPINTYADCSKNFILVNFSESFPIKTLILFPVVRR
jgi:hypothetical protein